MGERARTKLLYEGRYFGADLNIKRFLALKIGHFTLFRRPRGYFTTGRLVPQETEISVSASWHETPEPAQALEMPV
jgi:hypothetical protein